jgi:hypothetical protein
MIRVVIVGVRRTGALIEARDDYGGSAGRYDYRDTILLILILILLLLLLINNNNNNKNDDDDDDNDNNDNNTGALRPTTTTEMGRSEALTRASTVSASSVTSPS